MHHDKSIQSFLAGKSPQTLALFEHFVARFAEVGHIELHAAKTMIGVVNGRVRVAWITQLGKNFVHVVFPFKKAYPDNLCFQKIAQVPGEQQFNHHFRMYAPEDVNEEVMGFMKMAWQEGF
ncbi:DUF5655 domain-containing protein [Chitinophaga vietnamensis]|uniref:DUF5655 domain-containing protein n=1 Tax=Chitinophaga vietnamensis TaxID=2593957 RepID=UPI001177A026|nr:DUF5655 domain-containing protein [Chitinophaga vietnamensis]